MKDISIKKGFLTEYRELLMHENITSPAEKKREEIFKQKIKMHKK